MEKLDHFDVVKYGTSTLTRQDGKKIDYNNIADQGAVMADHKEAIGLVTSGAVGFGGTFANFDHVDHETIRKQILALKGNPHLAVAWDEAIPGKEVLQGLSTHRDFSNGGSIRAVTQAIYTTGLPLYAILALNENDFASDEELREARKGEMGDNDQNAVALGLVAKSFSDFVRISIGTESGGFRENKGSGLLVPELAISDLTDAYLTEHCGPGSNGGSSKAMRGKLEQSIEAIRKGIDEVWIFDGKNAEELQAIFNGQHAGTKIIKSHNLSQI